MGGAARRNLLSLAAYQFYLPEELIAQHPTEKRDCSRLMIVDRASQQISEIPFSALPEFLKGKKKLVLNDTKVIPARLLTHRETGGKVEILLLKPLGNDCWEALVKPSRKLPFGSKLLFSDDFWCEVEGELESGKRVVRFHCLGDFYGELERFGKIPLPPYIHREAEQADLNRYQTVYAKQRGAVAAPTAGLHFTPELLAQFEPVFLTLHVGLGTFRPVQDEKITDHRMHAESFVIPEETARRLNAEKHIVVGTTTLRALESAANEKGEIVPGAGETSIFIYPGYTFRYVDTLLTNFHLPGSTLLMLVSAFAGYDLMREAYAQAVKERFRFFSYGDAMLIL